MRIAIIVEYLHARGGTQRQALELGIQLQKLGHDVTVFTKSLSRTECFPHLTRQLKLVATSQTKTFAQSSRRGPRNERIRKTAKMLGVDYALAAREILRSSRSLATAVIQQHVLTPFDVINPHDFGAAAWCAAELTKRLNVPVVWQCNDPFLRWDDDRGTWCRAAQEMLRRLDFNRVRGLSCITVLEHTVAREVERRYDVAPIVVKSGVDHDRFGEAAHFVGAKRTLGIAADQKVILVLSLLNGHYRRIGDVIAAHLSCPEHVWLLLVAPKANNEYSHLIEQQIRGSQATERILWIDHSLKNDQELKTYFDASDVFVFPNEHQTWGLAVIEAASAGLPVVVSRGAGVHEVFESGTQALLYDAGDVAKLTQHLCFLFNHESERLEIAGRGQQLVRNKFSWLAYAKEMEKELLHVVDAKKSRAGRRK